MHVVLARGALAARQAELEVGVAAGRRDHGVERLVGQHRAAEVGVRDDAGGVDDAPQRRRDGRRDELLDPGDERGRREVAAGDLAAALQDLAPQAVDDRAYRIDDELARVRLEQRSDRGWRSTSSTAASPRSAALSPFLPPRFASAKTQPSSAMSPAGPCTISPTTQPSTPRSVSAESSVSQRSASTAMSSPPEVCGSQRASPSG